MGVYWSAEAKYSAAERAGDPCHEPTQDEKLKECMTVCRAAEAKFKAMVPH